jgi:hypothetical protein
LEHSSNFGIGALLLLLLQCGCGNGAGSGPTAPMVGGKLFASR